MVVMINKRKTHTQYVRSKSHGCCWGGHFDRWTIWDMRHFETFHCIATITKQPWKSSTQYNAIYIWQNSFMAVIFTEKLSGKQIILIRYIYTVSYIWNTFIKILCRLADIIWLRQSTINPILTYYVSSIRSIFLIFLSAKTNFEKLSFVS